MTPSGADIISVDWTVDMAEARQRLGKDMKVQGNIDPGVLFGSHEVIRDRILDTIRKHGVLVGTPEDNVRYFFETAKQADQLLAHA
jgi:uroporphyrinogen decarboxylase